MSSLFQSYPWLVDVVTFAGLIGVFVTAYKFFSVPDSIKELSAKTGQISIDITNINNDMKEMKRAVIDTGNLVTAESKETRKELSGFRNMVSEQILTNIVGLKDKLEFIHLEQIKSREASNMFDMLRAYVDTEIKKKTT